MPDLCSRCHSSLKDQAQFCSKCGTPVSVTTASAKAGPTGSATTAATGPTTNAGRNSPSFTQPPRQTELCDDTRLHGWTWGGFFLSWIWLFAHNLKRQGMGFLALLLVVLSLVDRSATVQNFVWRLDQHFPAAAQPSLLNAYISNLPVTVILMALCIPVGLRGNDWVSKYGKFENYGWFVASQRQWATWGAAAFLVTPFACYTWSLLWMDVFHILM